MHTFEETEAELSHNATPLSETNDDPNEAAKELGLVVVESNSTTLLLDIDSKTAYRQTERLLESLNKNLPDLVHSVHQTTSKSGNLHIYIKLNEPLPLETRLLLQAALGSDPMRELLSYIRTTKGIRKVASVLFETTQAAQHAQQFTNS
jgi:hypothetical protein